MVSDRRCMCKKNGESGNQLLLHYEVARTMWDDFFAIIGLSWVIPLRLVDFVASWRGLQEMDDIFESSLHLEETHFEEGYSDGYKHGLVLGKEEAQQVGLRVGFETGEELGFYRGCIDIWNFTIQVDRTRFSDRIQKMIKQMEELVEIYPVSDPESESIQELMEALRLKFRAISATLGLKLEYSGYPKMGQDPKEIGF